MNEQVFIDELIHQAAQASHADLRQIVREIIEEERSEYVSDPSCYLEVEAHDPKTGYRYKGTLYLSYPRVGTAKDGQGT